MDFILFLVFAGVVFYFNQIKPRQNQRANTELEERAPQQVLRQKPIKTETSSPSPTTYSRQTIERPRMPPLHGIEISATQCRRLGKDDPSVIAAQLNKAYSTGTGHPPSFFDQLKQQLEKVAQSAQAHSHSTSPTAPTLSKQLHKIFDDLFSEQRPR